MHAMPYLFLQIVSLLVTFSLFLFVKEYCSYVGNWVLKLLRKLLNLLYLFHEELQMCSRAHIWWIWLDLHIEKYQWSIRKHFGIVVNGWELFSCSEPFFYEFTTLPSTLFPIPPTSLHLSNFILNTHILWLPNSCNIDHRASRGYGFCISPAISSWSSRRTWSDNIHRHNCNSCFDGKQPTFV